MAYKIICSGSTGVDNDCGDVPTLAGDVEDWRVVSQHVLFGTDRVILRDGHLSTDTILRDYIHGTTWTMAVSESL